MPWSRLRIYLVSIGLVIAVTVVKLAVPPLGHRLPFVLYFAAVMIAAWKGGRGPAAVTILLSMVAANYYFLQPAFAFGLTSRQLLQSLVFIGESVAIAVLSEVLSSARGEAGEATTRLATTLRSIGEAVVATDADGRITFMNPVAEQLTKWSEDDARGKPLGDVVRVEDRDTHVLVAKDGTATPIDDSRAPIRDPRGNDRGVVVVFRNVSEERQHIARRELLADAVSTLTSSLDYRAILKQLASIVVPRFADWCTIEMIDEETGKSEQLAVAHTDPKRVELAIALRDKYPRDPNGDSGVPKVLRTGRAEHYPLVSDELIERLAVDEEHLRIARELRLRSAVIVPLVVRGKTIGAITMVHDASSGRTYSKDDLAFAEQLAERAAVAVENARLYTRERTAREAADRATRLKDEFLATLSHELRTPLTSILGWARMLSEGRLPEPKKARALETIERNTVAMAQLVDDLLDVSRIISGKLRIDAQATTLAPIVDAAIESVKPAAQAKEIVIRTTLEDATPVYGDARRLQQVFWNLLSNAVKFTPRRGRVDVTVRREGSSVELTVSDNGRGIDADFLPFVFDRFRQADGSFTRQAGGLGLGLAICRHLVELHGGTIEARSEGRDRGATFVIHLPIAAVRAAAPTDESGPQITKARSAPPARERPAELRGKRVLVVDDDDDARALVATVLDECGCTVSSAANVAAALERFEREVPDVLISDIGMPEQDGYELIKRIRALPPERGGNVPAAALTAYARTDDRRRALDAGYMTHVVKPVDPSELVAVVTSLVRYSQAS